MPADRQFERGSETNSPVFATTHWSVVLAASGGEMPKAAVALETLCQSYWYPLYAFVRRNGHSPHDAQDLTQAFFARLLEKNYVCVQPSQLLYGQEMAFGIREVITLSCNS